MHRNSEALRCPAEQLACPSSCICYVLWIALDTILGNVLEDVDPHHLHGFKSNLHAGGASHSHLSHPDGNIDERKCCLKSVGQGRTTESQCLQSLKIRRTTITILCSKNRNENGNSNKAIITMKVNHLLTLLRPGCKWRELTGSGTRLLR